MRRYIDAPCDIETQDELRRQEYHAYLLMGMQSNNRNQNYSQNHDQNHTQNNYHGDIDRSRKQTNLNYSYTYKGVFNSDNIHQANLPDQYQQHFNYSGDNDARSLRNNRKSTSATSNTAGNSSEANKSNALTASKNRDFTLNRDFHTASSANRAFPKPRAKRVDTKSKKQVR
jgi:hypothetical protein